jgi:hypothetical protein
MVLRGGKKMHSRIFQVSKTPIDPENFLTESEIPESFIVATADYVGESENRTDDIAWLMNDHSDVLMPGPVAETFQLAKNGKECYFRRSYRRFLEAVAMLTTTTFQAFIAEEPGPGDNAVDYWMYQLKEAYSNKFGFYIYEDEELKPMNMWIRNAKADTVYYIGGVLDYHF